MTSSYTITFEGDYIKVLSDGDKDLEFATELWSEVAKSCREHDCFNVLGIAETDSPMSTLDGYELAQVFRDLGIVENHRIAWVELNQEAKHATYFIETVLSNRGLPGRLFSSAAEAKEWLLSDGNA